MSNLVTLCRFHRRKVHEAAVVVLVLDDGAIRFVQPNGESFDSASRGCMDYAMAMDVLMSLRRDVSAETP